MYSRSSSTARLRPAGSALIVGVGALGCPAAATLVRAGARRVTLIDPDIVEDSNLQRQTLFGPADVGRPKVTAAAEALRRLVPAARVETLQDRLARDGATELVSSHDFVIDACDDPATKFLINEACIDGARPYSYGGVMGTGGQTMTVAPGSSACLACVFGDDGPTDGAGACSEMGILAPVAGVIGSLQGLAALRALSGGVGTTAGRMTIYNAAGRRWRTVQFNRDPRCPACAREQHQDSTRRREPCHS